MTTDGDIPTYTRKQMERICRTGIPGYDAWGTAGKGDKFNADEAIRAVDFIQNCVTHVEGDTAGQPFILERWQVAFVGNLFGWQRSNGARRYREALLFIARKNGKTPLVAACALYSILNDEEVGAQNYIGAGDRDQASYVFRHCCGMINQNGVLSDTLTYYKGYKVIEYPDIRVFTKVVSSKADTKHGGNVHLGIIDELHVTPRDLVDVMRTGTASKVRKQPLVIYMTTSDYDRPDSICNEIVDRAHEIRDGLIKDRAFLPVIYEALPSDDYTDEKVWEKANPNLDVSVSRDYLRRECAIAQSSPAHRFTFQRLHLNIRTSTDVLWLDTRQWDTMAAPDFDTTGYQCWAGLDLGSTRDLTAFVRLYDLGDGRIYISPTFWCPHDRVWRERETGGVDYRPWADEGWLRTTPGSAVDYAKIRADIAGPSGIATQHHINEIAIDRLFQGEETAQGLAVMGFEDRIVAFGQGYLDMAAPTHRFDELFASGKILHDANPVMRWMIANAVVMFDDAGNMKVTKKKSTGKVDGVVAAIMALGRMMVAEDQTSVYEDRGLIEL